MSRIENITKTNVPKNSVAAPKYAGIITKDPTVSLVNNKLRIKNDNQHIMTCKYVEKVNYNTVFTSGEFFVFPDTTVEKPGHSQLYNDSYIGTATSWFIVDFLHENTNTTLSSATDYVDIPPREPDANLIVPNIILAKYDYPGVFGGSISVEAICSNFVQGVPGLESTAEAYITVEWFNAATGYFVGESTDLVDFTLPEVGRLYFWNTIKTTANAKVTVQITATTSTGTIQATGTTQINGVVGNVSAQ